MDEDQNTTHCLRCGKEIEKVASEVPLGEYCRDCFREISEMIEDGAVIVEEQETSSWSGYRIYRRGEEFMRSEDMDKVRAITLGREISDELHVEVLYKDDQENRMWVMDRYLNENPKIEDEVHDFESERGRGVLNTLRNKVRDLFS